MNRSLPILSALFLLLICVSSQSYAQNTPTGFNGSATGTTITLNWTNGGGGTSGYIIRGTRPPTSMPSKPGDGNNAGEIGQVVNDDDFAGETVIHKIVGSGTTTFNGFTGVVAGAEYTFRIFAYSGGNTGSTSASDITVFTLASDPGAYPVPFNFTAVSTGTQVNLSFTAASDPSLNADGYIVLRRQTSDPTTGGLTDGSANAGTYEVGDVTDPNATTFTDNFAIGSNVYHYALVPYKVGRSLEAGNAIMDETYNYGTMSTVAIVPTTTIGDLNVTGTNHVASSPMAGTNANNAILGFSLSANATLTASLIKVRFDADPATYLENFSLVQSTDNDFATTADNAVVTLSGSPAFSGTGPWFVDFDPQTDITLNTTAKNFFVVAKVKDNVATGTSVFIASLTPGDVTVSSGIITGTATGTDYDLTALTATIGSLNTPGTHHINASPLIGSSTGNAIFGFTLGSNGTQEATLIKIRFDADPTTYLQNFALVASADNDFNTLNTPVPLTPATPVISGTGPWFVELDPTTNIDISNATLNFFLVANVKGSVATTASAFQPSLTTADITLSQGTTVTGSATGIDYSLTEVAATIGSLNTPATHHINASPLNGSNTGNGIFGFTLVSTGAQQASLIKIRFDADPSIYLQNFSLVASADADFSTLNTPVALTPMVPVISGTGPYFLELAPSSNINISTTPLNFFLVADVKASVATTASAFQPSLTTTDITMNQGAITGSATGIDYSLTELTATVGSLNAAVNNIAASPLNGSDTGNGIFGFTLGSNGTQEVSLIKIQFDADPSAYLQNFSLVQSADIDFATANTPVVLNPVVPVVSGTGPYFLELAPATNIDISNTTLNFFLVADVKASVADGTSVFQPSLANADVTLSQGLITGSATGIDYDLTALTATLASLNLPANGITASPLVGSHTGNGIFGFSLGSNGMQTVSLIKIQFDADPSAYLQNFSLVQSADADFTTANTPVALTPAVPVVTGTGPYFLELDPTTNIDISNTTLNFFLVADVKASVADGTSVLQPSLASADITLNQGLITGSATGVDYDLTALTATITSLNTPATHHVATSPMLGGTNGAAVLGFSLGSNGTQQVSLIRVRFDEDPGPYLTSFSLVQSADTDVSTANTPVGLTPATPVVTGTGPWFVDLDPTVDINISNATLNFFLVANVKPDVATSATSAFQASITTADVTVSQGNKTGSATGLDYDITALTATIASLNAAANNVAASPLTGGTTGAAVLGFSLGSNGTQTVSLIKVRFDADPSLYLQNFSLVQSGDTDFSTANTPVSLTPVAPVVSGTGPWFVELDPTTNIDISNTTLNFFLVANVKPGVATGTSVFQASLTTADITVSQGNKAGSSTGVEYDLTGLTTTLTQLTTGIAGSPLAAGSTGNTSTNAILGFSLQSNGSQTVSLIKVALNADPSGKFTAYSLIESTDASFTTTGNNSTVSLSSSAVTGAGPYYVNITPSSALNVSSIRYFFVVATVNGGVNTTTAQVEPSLSSADVTVNQGSVTTTSFAGTNYTFIPSQNSTITFTAASYSSNIDYKTFQSAATLTSAGSASLGTFVIRDGGGAADADNQATTLTDLTISVTNPDELREIAIFDGTTNVAQMTSEPDGTIAFTGLTLAATDVGVTKTFIIRASFNAPVIDKNTHEVTILAATAANTGSTFVDGDANPGIGTGATTGTGATVNSIAVTATKLIFVETMPISVNPNSVFTLTARAVDILNSIDVDQTAQVVVTESGGPGDFTGDSENQTQNLIAGEYQWTGLKLTLAGTYTITGNHATFTGGNDATGQVVIESLGVDITVANMDLCTVSTGAYYTTMSNIVQTERDPSDMSPGTNLTFLLILPDGFEFRTTGYTPTVTFTPAKNITAVSAISYVGTTIARFTYSVSGIDNMDVLTISGLQVKNTDAFQAGDITRSGTGIIKGSDETDTYGVLTPTAAALGDFTVESQPGNAGIDPATTRFGIGDPAVILNGQIGGNPVSLTDGSFAGNGTSLKKIAPPISADRYIFTPASVNVGLTDVTFRYKDPTTGCLSNTTKQLRVQDLAIIGLQEQFCTNDVNTYNLSVNSIDIPGGYKIHDFVYKDPAFSSVTLLRTNTTNTATTQVQFYNASVPVALTNPTVIGFVTDITLDPFAATWIYDYNGHYGGGYIYNTPITNPIPGSYLYASTTQIMLTIPAHGLIVGDKITLNGTLNTITPSISFREFTVLQVINPNNIIINVTEGTVYSYSLWQIGVAPPYNIAITKKQTFDPIVGFRIPGHGFTTGDRIKVAGFANFVPVINNRTYTVTVIDANQIRINIAEEIPGTTVIRGNWAGQLFSITPDDLIPLPGYIHDTSQPFPHKGAQRSAGANTQFRPGSFNSTNWNSGAVVILDRIIPVACVGTGAAGCAPATEHSVPVRLAAPPIVDFTGLNSFYCHTAPGSPIVLTGANLFDGIFSGTGITDGGAGNATAQFNPIAGGLTTETPLDITFSYTDANGCTGTATKQVVVHNLPTVNAGGTAQVCEGSAVVIGGSPVATGNQPFSYSWNNAATLDDNTLANPKASPLSNTTYTVTVTDAFGCQETDDIAVSTFDPVIVNAVAPAAICGNNPAGIDISTSTISGPLTTGTWSTLNAGDFKDVGNANDIDFGDAAKFIPVASTGSVILTLTSDDPTGPCPVASDNVTIALNQAATVDAGPAVQFCANDVMTITNAIMGGSATSVTWEVTTGSGAIPASDEHLIKPTYLASNNEKILGGTVTLKVTTDIPSAVCPAATDNVTITVFQRPLVDASTDFQRCEDQQITLNGTIPANSTAGSITWSGGLGSFSPDAVTPNAEYLPHASEIGKTVILTITSDDPTGPCLAEQDNVNVRINVTPGAPLVNLPTPICEDATILPLTAVGTNIKWYENANKTNFRFSGSPFSTGVLSDVDKVVHFYATQTTAEGCESATEESTIIVYPKPVPTFSIQDVCEGDFTSFINTSSVTYTDPALPVGSIQSYAWTFGDGWVLTAGNGAIPSGTQQITIGGTPTDITTGTYRDPEHQYQNTGNFNVTLALKTTDGCEASLTTPFRIGAVPQTSFTYRDVCEGDDTRFTYSAGPAVPVGQIATWAWDFDDGVTSSTGNPLQASPQHKFPSFKTYNVALTITTDLNCSKTFVRKVAVLPYLQNFPYIESFEGNNHGWAPVGFPDADKYSWQLNNMAGNNTINAASDGNRAWFTTVASNGAGIYYDNERSALNTPCINVTALQRPVLSFDYWVNTHEADGAYLEASTDGGTTWSIVGNPNQGLEWYNRSSVLGLTRASGVGQDVDQFGWAGNTGGWKSGKFSLDAYKASTKLRLRFVFGSNSDNPNIALDGFALDKFELDSRNRIVLVENYTNTAQTINNINFITFRNALTNSEIIKLQYHTGLKGTDEINLQNPGDPNARAAFYGLTNSNAGIPRVYLDGVSQGSLASSTAWADNYLSLRSLAVSPFEIGISTMPNAQGALEVATNIQVKRNITKGKPVLIIAVVEKNVSSNAYVVRKLLPAASGFPLTLPIAAGQVITPANFTWNVDIRGINLSELAVVAFIQDTETKEVYQSAVNWNPGNLPSNVTGVEETFDHHFNVFPIPANREMTVELPEAATQRATLQLFDQLGKQVHVTTFEKGESRKTIPTTELTGGVYLIQVESPKGMLRRKVMVVHGN